jgi:UPF0755 protein
MIKKFFTAIVVIFVLVGTLGSYVLYKHAHRLPPPNPNTKAPQTSITLIEGWTNDDIAQYLQKQGIASSTNFLNAVANFDTSAYAALKSKPASASLEGFIFPDTYFIPKNPATSTNISNFIIKRALDNFEQKVTPEILAQANKNGLNFYKTLILASIIEKEANKNDSDRKTIAGVFYNRLNTGIALQSDATVNFITKKKTPSVTEDDTKINSPYNTYKYPGLPPGPICNPSLGSIIAALQPNSTDYLYFLTDPQTGRAVFAKTYDQHLANKQKYLK